MPSVRVQTPRTLMLAARLRPWEMQAVRDVARQTGESVSEFVRRVAMDAVTRHIAESARVTR